MAYLSMLYGLTGQTLEESKKLVEQTLEIALAPHDSFYRGGAYYLFREDDLEIILQRNFDALDNALAEVDHPGFENLLYVDGRDRAEEIASRLSYGIGEIALLRRSTY